MRVTTVSTWIVVLRVTWRASDGGDEARTRIETMPVLAITLSTRTAERGAKIRSASRSLTSTDNLRGQSTFSFSSSTAQKVASEEFKFHNKVSLKTFENQILGRQIINYCI